MKKSILVVLMLLVVIGCVAAKCCSEAEAKSNKNADAEFYAEAEVAIVEVTKREINCQPEPTEPPVEIKIDAETLEVVPLMRHFSEDTDLKANFGTITVEQMQIILDYWMKKSGNNKNTSLLGGKHIAEAFIEAGRETGYSPVFLLALCAQEAGWRVAPNHRSANNPYSINMTDTNNHSRDAKKFKGSFENGIIDGAKWISINYYNHKVDGKACYQKTLHDMEYKDRKYHQYCTNPQEWISGIVYITNKSYSLIYDDWEY